MKQCQVEVYNLNLVVFFLQINWNVCKFDKKRNYVIFLELVRVQILHPLYSSFSRTRCVIFNIVKVYHVYYTLKITLSKANSHFKAKI
jgi:hypothetical protein